MLAWVAGLLALGLPTSAAGASLEETVSAGGTTAQSCTDGLLDGRSGVATREVTAPSTGAVQARLSGSIGDWDLAIVDAETERLVAGSAYAATDEVAGGYVAEGAQLVVQACRRPGAGSSASLAVDFSELDPDDTQTAQLVKVITPDEASKARLMTLGLDLTEHAGPDFIGAVLHGTDDGALLRQHGFTYEILVADLGKQSARDRRADREYARGVGSSGLPSGQDTYRHLFDYSEDLKQLAADNPKLVRHFTLPFQTYEGRPVEGIEISKGVKKKKNAGRPVFLMMGLHHAREWPSGEHTIEWAYQLIEGFKNKEKPFRKLVKKTRTIIVPVVNPDGFNASREAGELQGAGNGRGGPGDETANIVAHPQEYRRKNCRNLDDSDGGVCTAPGLGVAENGVDPNRNYGGFWGGPGASTDQTALDYRGPGPFSEPETSNIQRLVSRNQVVTLITNHTFSDLVLRPPGVQTKGDSPDEKVLKRLGAKMSAENGYLNLKGYQLYDTSGTTEDWSYYTTGGLGYTFEIGCEDLNRPDLTCDLGRFHPPFEDMVAEWEGTTPEAGAGGGNEAAYLLAQKNTKKKRQHALIKGEAPPGAKLILKKKFKTKTSPVLDANGDPGKVRSFKDKLRTKMKVKKSGRFKWHINPSTRPVVSKKKRGPKPKKKPPSDPVNFSGDPSGPPGDGAAPCGDAESNDPGCYNDHRFVVPGGNRDNGTASVRIEWATEATDWDMQVYRDTDGDGTSAGEQALGASQQGPTTSEATTLARPVLQPGDYVVRVTNFAALEPYDGSVTFGRTPPRRKGKVESWKLVCKKGKKGQGGKARKKIRIERGETKRIDIRRACSN